MFSTVKPMMVELLMTNRLDNLQPMLYNRKHNFVRRKTANKQIRINIKNPWILVLHILVLTQRLEKDYMAFKFYNKLRHLDKVKFRYL